jgi:integrase
VVVQCRNAARDVTRRCFTVRGLRAAARPNPAERSGRTLIPRVRSGPRFQAFLPEQARAFLEAVCRHRLETAFTTAVGVGLRQGEILGLKGGGRQPGDRGLDGACRLAAR